MVRFIDSERAVARWEICGIVISLPHRRGRTNDEMYSIIESYINAVKNKLYKNDNTDLCNAFKTVGGLPFVKIGYLAMKEDFIEMFRYYAELFVTKWIDSNRCIHSKNVGIQYAFEEMLCHDDFEIKYDLQEDYPIVNAIIPPAGDAERFGFGWIKDIRKGIDEIVSKSTSKDEMMMFGLSYWHVDRNELDEILLSLDNKMEVRFVNPKPPTALEAVLTSLFKNYIHFSNSKLIVEDIADGE